MTESYKNGIIAEVACAWRRYDNKKVCNDCVYEFVDSGEFEKQAFLDWFENECCYLPDIEDVIENANRIQMIRDAFLEIVACIPCFNTDCESRTA